MAIEAAVVAIVDRVDVQDTPSDDLRATVQELRGRDNGK
jgi:hypothetical protein